MTSIHTRQFDGMLPERPGHKVVPGTVNGCAASWDDGMTTYTLQWGPAAGGFVFGWMMADELDTALMAVEAIRAGDIDRLRDSHFLSQSMGGVRKLRMRLEAIEEELLRQARDEDPTGSPTLSWRDAGDELRQHHTSVRERWQRSMNGQHAEFRNWLIQGLGEASAAPAAEPEHVTEIYGNTDQPGQVRAQCSCGWVSEPTTNNLTASLAANAHRAEHDNK
jgi:hypothetical protein